MLCPSKVSCVIEYQFTWSTNSSLCSTTNLTEAFLSSSALWRSARTRHSRHVSTVRLSHRDSCNHLLHFPVTLIINHRLNTSHISFSSDNWYLSAASSSRGDLVLRFSIFPAYMYLNVNVLVEISLFKCWQNYFNMSLTVSISRSSMSIFFSWFSVILCINIALNTGDLRTKWQKV